MAGRGDRAAEDFDQGACYRSVTRSSAMESGDDIDRQMWNLNDDVSSLSDLHDVAAAANIHPVLGVVFGVGAGVNSALKIHQKVKGLKLYVKKEQQRYSYELRNIHFANEDKQRGRQSEIAMLDMHRRDAADARRTQLEQLRLENARQAQAHESQLEAMRLELEMLKARNDHEEQMMDRQIQQYRPVN